MITEKVNAFAKNIFDVIDFNWRFQMGISYILYFLISDYKSAFLQKIVIEKKSKTTLNTLWLLK